MPLECGCFSHSAAAFQTLFIVHSDSQDSSQSPAPFLLPYVTAVSESSKNTNMTVPFPTCKGLCTAKQTLQSPSSSLASCHSLSHSLPVAHYFLCPSSHSSAFCNAACPPFINVPSCLSSFLPLNLSPLFLPTYPEFTSNPDSSSLSNP